MRWVRRVALEGGMEHGDAGKGELNDDVSLPSACGIVW